MKIPKKSADLKEIPAIPAENTKFLNREKVGKSEKQTENTWKTSSSGILRRKNKNLIFCAETTLKPTYFSIKQKTIHKS